MTFRVRREEFDRTLAQYRKVSKRDIATIVNTKASFIARRAVLETPKASAGKIRGLLTKKAVVRQNILGQRVRISKSGKISRGRFLTANVFAPLAALIINARRGRAGKPGLTGAAMAEAIKAMISARIRSIAFLKSGWLPAIKKLLPFVDKGGPRTESAAKEYGRSKGDATPAREGDWRARATITNAADAKHDKKQALIMFGEPALQRAFDAEEASMREYMERKMRDGAREAGIKTN